MASNTTATRTKVTVSLDRVLVAAIDQAARETGQRSRSRQVEEALLEWSRLRGQREVDREVERYYVERTAREEQEDREWTAIASLAAARVFRGRK